MKLNIDFEPDIDRADQKIRDLTELVRDCRKEFLRLTPRVSLGELDQALQERIRKAIYG